LIKGTVPTSYIQQLSLLLKRLLLSFLLYQWCRLLFFLFNLQHFPNTGVGDLISDSFFGLRFDSFSIVVSNSLFILLSLLPVRFFYSRWYQVLLKWLFCVANAVFIACNFIDIAYFDFIRKRSSADLFKQIGGQSDLFTLLPSFLLDFWLVFLLFILSVIAMTRCYAKNTLHPAIKGAISTKGKILVAVIFILSVGFSVLAVRGGLQRVPIDIVNAGAVTSAEEVPIVLNTPFTLIKSVNQKALEEVVFYPETQLKTIYDPVHHYRSGPMNKMNVVVLILESFSKEYTKLGRNLGWTPFLDSLMDHSLVCSNAFSNGTKSIEGIPAILSSLPSLTDNPYINSLYANNRQTSFANILKDEGYQSAFFHGGINGTMNFDDWSPMAGYDEYYGRNEYNNEDDFDGFWGIWDEPFLQYSIKKMSSMKEPFHSAIFTLSSHHPYFIPKQYAQKFKKGELENAESIQYADYSVRQFFNTAKKAPWFNNTLFVLVADHCGISGSPFYSNWVGNLTIPVVFYKPDNSLKQVHKGLYSQIDILPTALSILKYDKPFFAYGNNTTEKKNNYSVYYVPGMHFVYSDTMVYGFAEHKAQQAFNYSRDSVLTTNLAGKQPATDSVVTAHFRAFLQTYNSALIHNEGVIKNTAGK
jgi:phosphoglycerol transferase MdoB-like AlkP superfamily enzyme